MFVSPVICVVRCYVNPGIFNKLLIVSHHSLDHIPGGRDQIAGRKRFADVSPPSGFILQQSAVNRTANMAAKYFYLQGFLLLLFNFISTAALEKRFSDFKRCADEECSSKFASLLFKTNWQDLKDASLQSLDSAASYKLRLISRPVANRYRPGEHPLFVPKLCDRLMPFKNSEKMYIYINIYDGKMTRSEGIRVLPGSGSGLPCWRIPVANARG